MGGSNCTVYIYILLSNSLLNSTLQKADFLALQESNTQLLSEAGRRTVLRGRGHFLFIFLGNILFFAALFFKKIIILCSVTAFHW